MIKYLRASTQCEGQKTDDDNNGAGDELMMMMMTDEFALSWHEVQGLHRHHMIHYNHSQNGLRRFGKIQ